MQLVIVESPAKAKTIEKYLGGDFHVLASYGHIRDLPAKDGSVDPDDGFAMSWENYGDKGKQLKAISDAAKKATRLILATDPDREGEAISWHVQEVLRAKKALPAVVDRVTFNAITKTAVLDAMAKPRALDEDLIDAYRARRALDYLVGFTLSPVLWRKLPGAKSAGRVQSVALRLVVEREREIESFTPQEYWSVAAEMEQDGTAFTARLVRWKGEKIERLTIGREGDAMAAKADVEAGRFTVEKVETKPLTRNPPPPFTTSTLQQEAARKLGFSASHTMRIAQQLYEDGAITYMRTDGVQMDGSAISAARVAIAQRYDGGYVPDKPRIYQTKAKNAQEAHEAIRPTEAERESAGNNEEQKKLYHLIRERTIASQMSDARLLRAKIITTIKTDIAFPNFSATGSRVIFDGWLACDKRARGEDIELPKVARDESLNLKDMASEEKHTEPPPRYTEAGLVKELEKRGIGRPSTYASIIKTINDRKYVEKDGRALKPTDTGEVVSSFLENPEKVEKWT